MNDKRLWKWFSLYIRVRDAKSFTGLVKCFTCPATYHYTEMDCGHGVPRQHLGTKFHERNNHAQCKKCNAFEGGAQAEYMKQVDKRYGPGMWDKLMVLSRVLTKRNQVEIDALAEYYKSQYEKLKREKHL